VGLRAITARPLALPAGRRYRGKGFCGVSANKRSSISAVFACEKVQVNVLFHSPGLVEMALLLWKHCYNLRVVTKATKYK